MVDDKPKVTSLPEQVVNDLSPQNHTLYEYLQSGKKVSGLIAMTSLRMASLSSRVAQLRKLGLDIKGRNVTDHWNQRYMVYWIDFEDGRVG